MQQQVFDVVIVGGGMAGAALALALSELPLKIALVEAQPYREGWPPQEESVFDYDARVSALTEASQLLLDRLGVWADIKAHRACSYSDMDVWDAEGTGHIHFSAAEVNRRALGHIVENRLIAAALLNKLQQCAAVKCFFSTPVESLDCSGEYKVLHASDGVEIAGRLLVAADGANSRIRKWAGFQTREWDYNHHAIVCTAETTEAHRATAWQRFLPSGPLAFLPLPDGAGEQRYSSIVWSAPPEQVAELMQLDDQAFSEALGVAFESRLGPIVACSKRFSFPLRQRHAITYQNDGVVLLGDAAHTIHPLAGQGINLGFLDVAALAEELQRACDRSLRIDEPAVLARYQRRRMGSNMAMMVAMEGFQHLFSTDAMPLRLLRNTGMSWLNKAVPIKRRIIAKAMGMSAFY
ncbi:MAG: UbiH/UbiF/VisC/COQ6 family ubiquinone biosynthesis hydroxylase [Spongiibacteraceae bacterium]